MLSLAEDANSMSTWLNINYIQLQDLTELVREGLAGIAHKIIVALITVDVHNRDIIENLLALQVESANDFNWQQ